MTYYKLENLRLTAEFLTLNPLQVDRALDEFIAASLIGGVVESYRIINKSVDSRRRNAELVYNLIVSSATPDLRSAGVVKLNIISEDEALSYLAVDFQHTVADLVRNNGRLPTAPIVVGSGPAGIFCAYFLALAGCRPIILDCGFEVEKRSEDIKKFYQTRVLDECSNFLMGEGGAGTFSDGKLYTRINGDWYGRVVLHEFIRMGVPEEIRYLKRPHIGSDNLFTVCQKFRTEITRLGGVFKFGFEVADLWCDSGRCAGVIGSSGEKIAGEYVVIAAGVGGHKLHRALIRAGVSHQLKGFQLGCRIEHPQKMVDNQQYHTLKRPVALGAAEYNFVSKPPAGVPGVSTFCMCPGGYVVNASSEKERLAINGMSNHARDSKNANSALVVTVTPKDFGNHPLDGVSFQRNLEEKAYRLGKGKIPLQLYKDYLQNQVSFAFDDYETEMKGDYTFANLNELFPQYINDSLKEAMTYFGKKIPHFDDDSVLLSGIESRTSSPVRIIRDEHFEANIKGIYPCGEGAGYAGGITTAAIDGLKVAESVIKDYSVE